MVTQRQAKSKKVAPPDINWLTDEATKLEQFWGPQKDRMEEDQELYELFREEPLEGESNVVKNTPRAQANKVKRMLAGAEWHPVFDPAARQPKKKEQPQREEDLQATMKEQFLLWCWDQADQEWRNGLTTGLKETLVAHAIIRGMVAVRVKPAADVDDNDLSSFPFEITAFDPLHVYPRLVGRKIKHILHVYETEWDEIALEWGIEDASKQSDDTVQVVEFYSDTYWAVAVDGAYVLEPTEHGLGFNPVICHVGEGGEIRAGRKDSGNEWTKFLGTGLLEDNRQTYKDRNRVATLRDEMITRTVNPAALVWTADGVPKVIDLRSGALNNMDRNTDEKVQLLNPGAASPDLAKAEGDFDTDIQLGGVPNVLWGSSESAMAGYAISLQQKGAKDILTPWLNCLKGVIKQIDICLLKMATNTDVGIRSMFGVRSTSSKLGAFKAQINADEFGEDFNHDVEFGDILPSDMAGLINMGIAATNAENPLFSAGTWLEKFGQMITNDPEGEFIRIMKERASLAATGQLVAQLGVQSLMERLGEEGMQTVFGNARKAPVSTGLAPSTLPPAEATGEAPPEPGAEQVPEMNPAMMQQAMAAQGQMGA